MQAGTRSPVGNHGANCHSTAMPGTAGMMRRSKGFPFAEDQLPSGAQFRKKPTSPGIPSGKLMIVAFSLNPCGLAMLM